jgi:hypothetical protein
MLQYVFFHQQPFDLFIEFITARGLQGETSIDDMSYEISLNEDIDDSLMDEIDVEYDRLLDMNQQLMEADVNTEHDYAMAAIDVPLAGGLVSQAFFDPDLINRVMQVINAKEMGVLVKAIVDAVENPDQRSFCQRVRDGDATL